jgi:hypothetical protein
VFRQLEVRFKEALRNQLAPFASTVDVLFVRHGGQLPHHDLNMGRSNLQSASSSIRGGHEGEGLP